MPDIAKFAAAAIGFACGAAAAATWSVQRVGINLYQVAQPRLFVRTEDCDERPQSGAAELQKEGGSASLVFSEPAVRCKVRDILTPAKVDDGEFTVRLTLDQTQNWYQVTDSDLYLNTVGCFSRTFSEIAVLTMDRGGTGRIRFPDGRGCSVLRAYRRTTL